MIFKSFGIKIRVVFYIIFNKNLDDPDDKAIYNFLCGNCFHKLKEFSKAEHCFNSILNRLIFFWVL